ncbi:hypothetical protein [Bartonella tribocorum]|uniref:hypothetical protein n=1 Tax=Bartonella tribocorum TaxID=85701 RepID=UPI0015DDD423|nr:hypothetical protein [Bartonella tribocorum]
MEPLAEILKPRLLGFSISTVENITRRNRSCDQFIFVCRRAACNVASSQDAARP